MLYSRPKKRSVPRHEWTRAVIESVPEYGIAIKPVNALQQLGPQWETSVTSKWLESRMTVTLTGTALASFWRLVWIVAMHIWKKERRYGLWVISGVNFNGHLMKCHVDSQFLRFASHQLEVVRFWSPSSTEPKVFHSFCIAASRINNFFQVTWSYLDRISLAQSPLMAPGLEPAAVQAVLLSQSGFGTPISVYGSSVHDHILWASILLILTVGLIKRKSTVNASCDYGILDEGFLTAGVLTFAFDIDSISSHLKSLNGRNQCYGNRSIYSRSQPAHFTTL